MQAPDFPSDEQQRLQALYLLGLLDTPQEERFDRLTRMAQRLFGVPIALVTLVDRNRQWFKSCVGLAIRETAREVSFCGHAILRDDLLVIEDATRDPRFADNPLVTGEPGIRFYAGCPLHDLQGHPLGTLCVIDRRSREFTLDDRAALRDLAAMVEREIGAIYLATFDELTGVLSRRGLNLLGSHLLKMTARHEKPLSLAYLDLNAFKAINDTHGHAEGDRALRLFVNTLSAELRAADLLSRLGGDEFVLLYPDTEQQHVPEILERYRQALARCNDSNPRGYQLQFSAGVVQYDPQRHGSDLAALLAEADAGMYADKPR